MTPTAHVPPGGFGLPFIGGSLSLLANPYRFAQRRHQRYGPVFKTRFLGKPTVVMLGAEAQRCVFGPEYRSFFWRDGYSFTLPLFGDALMLTDGPFHDQQRKLMTPAFHGRHMGDYLERMNRVIDTQLATWSSRGTRRFYFDGRQIAFTLASSLLVGLEVGKEYRRLSKQWEAFTDGIVSLVRVDLPMTTFGRAMRARRAMEKTLRRLVAERRATPATDALGLLVQARDEDGNALSDEQLVAQTKLLIFAGYDTTAGTIAWLMVELLRHPEVLERVRQEVGAELPANRDAPVTIEDLRQRPYLDAVIKEVLRLHPQASFLARGVHKDFEFDGFRIPAGWSVLLMPSYTHRMEDYFVEPDRFDPERFLPPRDEDAKHPYAWAGFGGGPRTCLGAGLAQIEIKALVTQLLRRYDLTLVADQDLRPRYVPTSRPKGNVLISYRVR